MSSLIESTLVNFFQSKCKLPIVIAYSGGIDSQVLLYALNRLKDNGQLKNELLACHVNHGLSVNALSWQTFAQRECDKLGLRLITCQVSVKAKAQQSLEALARDARYDALCAHTPDNSLIVTGHHRDDQSETFLLALKRGAGLKGLSAMQTSMPLLNRTLVRPLLAVSRQEIQDYAEHYQLSWIEDESNQDQGFDRNFIRHEVMPVLKARWPSIDNTITRSIEHCQTGQSLLDELGQQDLERCQLPVQALSIDELNQLSSARFNNALRYFLSKQNCLMPSAQQLKQVAMQLNADSDKAPAIKVGDNWLRRYQNALYLTSDFQDVSQWSIIVKGLDVPANNKSDPLMITLPDDIGTLSFSNQNDSLDAVAHHYIKPPLKEQEVIIKFSHDNPTCLPVYRRHSRPLKKVLKELEIAPWLRKRIPFLYYDNQLVAAIGHFVCQEFEASIEQDAINIFLLK